MKKCSVKDLNNNHCPEKAIYTNKFKAEWQYPKPSKELVNKLESK